MRVDVDRIPTTGMPREVAALVDEAVALRDKLRHAAEQTAAAQARLERAEHDDAQAGAQRIRKGSPLGTEQPAVAKARSALDAAKRGERALTLAAGAAEADLGSAIRAASDGWIAELNAEQERASNHALDALADFERALGAMRDAAAASGWLQGALADDRYDRPARQPMLGSLAPSSARRTSNAEALNAGEVLGYARELVEPAPAPPVAIIEQATDVT
jgi:hypothetical protein